MSYGARFGGTYTGANLMPDLDNVYRFAGYGAWLTLQNSVLNDNGASRSVTVSVTTGDFGLCVQCTNNTFS